MGCKVALVELVLVSLSYCEQSYIVVLIVISIGDAFIFMYSLSETMEAAVVFDSLPRSTVAVHIYISLLFLIYWRISTDGLLFSVNFMVHVFEHVYIFAVISKLIFTLVYVPLCILFHLHPWYGVVCGLHNFLTLKILLKSWWNLDQLAKC